MKLLHAIFGCSPFWKRRSTMRRCRCCQRAQYMKVDYEWGTYYWEDRAA